MATFSFDIESSVDAAEMNNVFDQTKREITSRYDFKDTPASLNWLDNKNGLLITGNSDWQCEAILEIVRKKLAARGQDQRVLDTSQQPVTSNMKTTREVPFKQGLDSDKAKQLTKLIRDKMPKVKTQIQGDSVRAMSSSKDDLQATMQIIKSADLDYPLSFTNYR